jgi:hypothetical protein
LFDLEFRFGFLGFDFELLANFFFGAGAFPPSMFMAAKAILRSRAFLDGMLADGGP